MMTRSKRKAAEDAVDRIRGLKRPKLNEKTLLKLNKCNAVGTTDKEIINGKKNKTLSKYSSKKKTSDTENNGNEDFGKSERSALHLAVMMESKYRVKRLLESGADPNATDKWGSTPLHDAVGLRNTGIMQLLLDGGADPNFADKNGTIKQPVIHKAIMLECQTKRRGRLGVTKKLITHGANVNAVDHQGLSPIYIAAHVEYGPDYADLLELLLENGADPNSFNSSVYQLPLLGVLARGDLPSLKLFLKHGIDLKSYSEHEPLHIACANFKHPEVLEFLIALGIFDINGKIIDAPLHAAAKFNNPRAVEVLLDWGADVNVTDEYNSSTPLHMVHLSSSDDVEEDSEACVKLLLEHGADVDARTTGKFNETAIELALSRVFDDSTVCMFARMMQKKCILESSIAMKYREDFREMMPNDPSHYRFFEMLLNFTFKTKYHAELNRMRDFEINEGISLFDLMRDEDGKFWDQSVQKKLSDPEMIRDLMRQFPSYAGRIKERLQSFKKRKLFEEEAVERLSELIRFERSTFQLVLFKIVRQLPLRDLKALVYDFCV